MSQEFFKALAELKESARKTMTEAQYSSANLAFTHLDAMAAEMGVKANATVQETERSGKWLPPVGVECEYSIYGTGWYKCTIEHWLEKTNGIVYWVPHLNKYQTSHRNTNFRPIRTEREKEVDAMYLDITGEFASHDEMMDSDGWDYLAAAYDKGYRKQEDV